MPETNPTESDEASVKQDQVVYDVIGGGRIDNTMTQESPSNINNQMMNRPPTSSTLDNAGLTQGSQALSNIKVEQLCEILSREINRVREESVIQAREMQMQYEMELQALRNEFYEKQDGVQVTNHQEELFS